MKRTIVTISTLTLAALALTGCKSDQSAESAFLPSGSMVVPNERIYLADFGPMSTGPGTFYLGAGDSLGAACFARYVASLSPSNRIDEPMRYVTVPTDSGRPE